MDTPIDDMTKKELIAIAMERGLPASPSKAMKMRNDDLISFIKSTPLGGNGESVDMGEGLPDNPMHATPPGTPSGPKSKTDDPPAPSFRPTDKRDRKKLDSFAGVLAEGSPVLYDTIKRIQLLVPELDVPIVMLIDIATQVVASCNPQSRTEAGLHAALSFVILLIHWFPPKPIQSRGNPVPGSS